MTVCTIASNTDHQPNGSLTIDRLAPYLERRRVALLRPKLVGPGAY
jgi:hypothetical protein